MHALYLKGDWCKSRNWSWDCTAIVQDIWGQSDTVMWVVVESQVVLFSISHLVSYFSNAIARNPARGREAVQLLEKEGLHPELLILDVTSEESVTAAKQSLQKSHNRLDVLINNAAVLLRVRVIAGSTPCLLYTWLCCFIRGIESRNSLEWSTAGLSAL